MAGHIARDRDPDDHRGVNADAVHAHRAMAKYLFPPSAKGFAPWIHSHQQEYEARVLRHVPDESGMAIGGGGKLSKREPMPRAEYERLEAEFAAWLDDHQDRYHYDKETDSYKARALTSVDAFTRHTLHMHAVPVTLRGEQLAKRIDVNPLVWRHGGFEKAERVFFGIEGCIKADAILTALLAAGEPAAIFSVPSVSLWEATYPAAEDEIEDGDELAAFVQTHLLGKLVCIVPDADAGTKDEVMMQALLCRSTVRRLGAQAEIVLPPDDRLEQGIKGVDDYLGSSGRTLDGMVWFRKEPPDERQLGQWRLGRQAGTHWPADRLQRAIETLQALATHAGEQGQFSASVRLLSRAIGRRRSIPEARRDDPDALDSVRKRDPEAARKRFERGIKDLLEVGAITSNKPLSIRQERWLERQSGWHLAQGLDWAQTES